MYCTNLTEAIVGSLVGDYLLQNDWMARGKKNHVWICLVHSAIWSLCVMLFSGWRSLGGFDSELSSSTVYLFLILTVLHFWQDHTNIVQLWMKAVGQKKFAEPPLGPWSTIVVDNVWHMVVLWAISMFVTSSPC